MRSNNPVLSRLPEAAGSGYAVFEGAPGRRPSRTSPPPGWPGVDDTYAAPAPADTERMTYDHVIMRTGSLFAVLLVAAAATWLLAPGLTLVGLAGGFILGLVNAFKREPSPALVLAYGAFEGMFLGGISKVFEDAYNGIVVQAVLATLSTFAVMLVLYRSGRIRVTPRFTRIMLVAVGGYALFCLVNLGVALFTDVNIRSGGLGLAIGAVGAVLAALSLVLDFDFIDRGVREGIPARYAWTAAFGLAVTLVWLYIEFLRILAILRGTDE
jgi:uncharacterized YccA/Bax inhibitor family protein